jgi:putative tricarboxylic transport membrane protein
MTDPRSDPMTDPVTDPAAEHDSAAGPAAGPFVAGAALVAFGLLMLSQVPAIKADGIELGGPRFFPLLVLVLLTALSVVYLLQQLRAVVRRTGLLPVERFQHLPAAAALVGLLVVYAFVLAPVGYVIATSGFFVGASRAMGSRQLPRDVVVGIGLALLVYLSFTRLLGVSLPAGVLPL